MSDTYISSKNEVEDFLNDLKAVLNDSHFNINTDLNILPKKKNEKPDDPYTTENTMLDLEYDSSDVRRHMLSLSLSNYHITFVDDIDCSLPPFFAFGKTIQKDEVYIKVKIKDRRNCKIFCVSFHYPRYPITYQY